LARWLREAGLAVADDPPNDPPSDALLTHGEALATALQRRGEGRHAVVMDELLADGHGLQTLYRLLLCGVPVVVLTASRSSDVWVEAWRGGALDCLPWPAQGPQEVEEVMGAVKRALEASAQTPPMWGQLRALPPATARGPTSDGPSQTLVVLVGSRAVDGLMQAMAAWSGQGGALHSCVVCVDALHRALRPALFQALGLQGFWSHQGLLSQEGLRAGFHVLTARELGAWVPALQEGGGAWPAPPRAWMGPLLAQLAPLGLAQVLVVAHGDLDAEDEAAVQGLLREGIALAQKAGHGYRFFDGEGAQPLLLEADALWATILMGGSAEGGSASALARWTALA
jgi:hypothetical protein